MKKTIKLLKLLTISTIFLTTVNAAEVTFKYWKLPDLKNVDLIKKEKDIEIYKKWISSRPMFTIVNNVTEEFAIRKFSTFFKPMCTNNLGDKNYRMENRESPQVENSSICLLIAPGLSRDYNYKKYKYRDRNNDFNVKPALYALKNEVGIMVFNLSDKFYYKKEVPKDLKHEIESIDKAINQFAEISGIKKENIITIGSFGVSKHTLSSLMDSKDKKVLISGGSKIVKINKKYELKSTEHIILSKKSTIAKNIEIDYNMQYMSKKYGSKDKNLNLQNFSENVSNYYPLSLKINHDFKIKE